MQRVSVADLKARLSEYLAAVKAGEEVVITDRGKPVARLAGLSADDALEARVAELVRAGLATPPKRKLTAEFIKTLPAVVKENIDGDAGVEAILHDRRTGH